MKNCIFFLLLTSCSTVPETYLPPQVTQREASWDGNVQNSGLISYDEKGFQMTESAIRRYLSLVEKFEEAPVGIVQDGDKWYLTHEGMANFLDLNDRRLNN